MMRSAIVVSVARMFVGVWPNGAVRAALGALPRPDNASVRWTPPDHWHVTLRFLGEVDEAEFDGLIAAVRGVAATRRAPTVHLGPATRVLHSGVLMVPAAGLDATAAAVLDATAAFRQSPTDRAVTSNVSPNSATYTGHVTVARPATRRGRIPKSWAGSPIDAAWEAREIALIRSHLGGGPARYETIASGTFAQSHGAFAP